MWYILVFFSLWFFIPLFENVKDLEHFKIKKSVDFNRIYYCKCHKSRDKTIKVKSIQTCIVQTDLINFPGDELKQYKIALEWKFRRSIICVLSFVKIDDYLAKETSKHAEDNATCHIGIKQSCKLSKFIITNERTKSPEESTNKMNWIIICLLKFSTDIKLHW